MGAAIGAAGMTEFISFAIGDEQYGVDIMAVREIKEWTDVTHLPRHADHVRDLHNLRGVMVPIIDMRCRFGQGPSEPTPTHIVIEGRQVGLMGDRALDSVSFEASKIQPAPKVATGARNSFLSGLVKVEVAMIVPVDLGDLLSVQINADEDISTPATQPPARRNH